MHCDGGRFMKFGWYGLVHGALERTRDKVLDMVASGGGWMRR